MNKGIFGRPYLGLALALAGCSGVPVTTEAICDGTAEARTDHAAALVADAGPQSRATGRTLIALVDAGCGDQ